MKTRVLKIAVVLLIMAGLFYVSTSHMTKAQKEQEMATGVGETGKLVIVDIQRVLAESKAGKNLQKQVTEQQEKIDADAAKKDKTLKSKRDELVKKQADMKKEDFIEAGNKFQQDIITARNELTEKSTALKQSTAQAVQKLRLEIVKVVSDMASENGYALVMTKQNVILAQKEMDISDDVLESLNKSISSIKLEPANSN